MYEASKGNHEALKQTTEELVRKFNEEFKPQEPLEILPWFSVFAIGLYSRFTDKPVSDFWDIESDELFEDLASSVVKKAEAERHRIRWEEDHTIKELRQELSPSLTWGEVFNVFVKDCVEAKDKATLKELSRHFEVRRYCIECHKPFVLSKYNPGYFLRCPNCSRRIRAQRHRTRQEVHRARRDS